MLFVSLFPNNIWQMSQPSKFPSCSEIKLLSLVFMCGVFKGKRHNSASCHSISLFFVFIIGHCVDEFAACLCLQVLICVFIEYNIS